MKNVSKNNKFLTCFRPVVDIDDMLESEAISDHRSSTCKHIAAKHDTTNSSTKSKFLSKKCSKLTQNQVVHQPPKNTLAKVIKVVVFETILNTRAHKKNRYNSQINCFGSKRSYRADTESSSKCGDEKSMEKTNVKEIKARELVWSSSSSSSSGSSVSEIGHFKNQKCLGVYVILISLIVTVLWGKINVIIFMSTLFCCFSLWNASSRRVKRVAELSNRGFKVQKNSQSQRNVHNGH